MEKIKRYLHGFIKYRYLLNLRTIHEIKAKYKNSYLGIVWSLINPLLQMVVLSIVFSAIFKSRIENFPLYMISGKIVFDFFSESTSRSLMTICRSADLIKKVYFPKYILVLSSISAGFVIMLISLIDLVLVMLVTGAPFTIYLLYAPLYLFLLYIFVVGCGLILSTLNVFFRDMEHLYSVLIMLLMYLSALFYPVDIIPAMYQKFFLLNPIYHYIVGFRFATYYGIAPDIGNILYCVGASAITFFAGIVVFKKNQDKFILYI